MKIVRLAVKVTAADVRADSIATEPDAPHRCPLHWGEGTPQYPLATVIPV
jgi:hypothetical protein